MIRVVLLMSLSVTCCAKNLGVIGRSFPVAEKSFLTLIYERLDKFSDKEALEVIQNKWIQQVENHVIRPTPVRLIRINKTTTHFYTPTVTLKNSIKDANGTPIIASGTSVNALEKTPTYEPQWVFINQDDKAQVMFAKNYLKNRQGAKLILTGGDIKKAEQIFDRTIYFDQEGKITKKLTISHVPATVSRQGNSLLVTELEIKENGDAL